MAGQLTANDPLLVHVLPRPDGDDEELAELTALLREEVAALDVAAVEPVTEEQPPESSKGIAAVIGGWLAVNLGREALRAVVARVTAWATQANLTVELSVGGDVLKVSGISREQQNRLIDDWIDRHTPAS